MPHRSAVLVYQHKTSQLTVWATITASKPGAVAAIIISEGLPGAGWWEII
jgi:hypothetical protein